MKEKKIITWGIIVILWMAFIFLMSSFDANDSDSQSKTVAMTIVEKYDEVTGASEDIIMKHHEMEYVRSINHLFRKMAHGFVYLVLALLLIKFFTLFDKYSLVKCILFSMCICFFYACTDEFHQIFINGRTGKFRDVIIDSVGSFIGCTICIVWRKIKKEMLVKKCQI